MAVAERLRAERDRPALCSLDLRALCRREATPLLPRTDDTGPHVTCMGEWGLLKKGGGGIEVRQCRREEGRKRGGKRGGIERGEREWEERVGRKRHLERDRKTERQTETETERDTG